jgi:ABC-type uncharacterized transport system permease subunit
MQSIILSAGLAGLAGMIYVVGKNTELSSVSNDIPGYGFNGITIALIG